MKKVLGTVVVTASLLAAGFALADGAADYKAKCASCHGADGKGNAGMAGAFKVEPAALDVTKAGAAANCVKITTEGKGKMPAYKDKLSADQITAVCAAMPK